MVDMAGSGYDMHGGITALTRSASDDDMRVRYTGLDRMSGTVTWRRRTGIEPASDGCRRSPVLKTGAPTRNTHASITIVARNCPTGSCSVLRVEWGRTGITPATS